jgi:hypothetical protein
MPTDRIVIHFSDGEQIAFRPKGSEYISNNSSPVVYK